jgi:PAS domain S-box-containing protein
VSSSPAAQNELSSLLVRLVQSEDFAAAARRLFTELLHPVGIQRGLVLLETRDGVSVVERFGVPSSGADAVRLDDGEAAPLAEALRTGQPALLEAEEGAEADADSVSVLLGSARRVVLPLHAGTETDDTAFALVLGDAGTLDHRQVDEISESLRQVGPVLARVCELERLRLSARQLEHQRELLTAIVNALPDPVLITDAQNRVLLENRRAETLLTTSEADSEGRRRAVEINNLLFSSFISRLDPTGGEGRELNLVDPSEGGDLLFEVISTGLPEEVYPGTAVVSVLREVTDLKRAAAELERQFKRVRQAELKSRRERDRLNLILETVGDPILVTDDQANIILMNREAERLFEVPPGTELKDRRRREIRANDTKFSSLISDLALSPDLTRVAETQLADPDTRTEFPAEVVSGKIFNERGEMAAIVSIVHDMTKVVENERLAAELVKLNEGLEGRVRSATAEVQERNRQLEWQRHELERAYRLKSEFLASMSHELRTPINALLGYTSLMRDRIYGDLTQRQDEALQRMYAASQHLLELVNDVLDLAKIEAGKMPIHVEPVDLALLVREISLTIEPMVRSKKLEFSTRLVAAPPPLETDRTKVKQILLNLLSNAVKFTHEGKVELVVHACDGREFVEIEVSDSGIGISPEDMDKIFEDFRQVDQSSTREFGGTGLGLSITRKLLHLLGGSISVQSEPGRGSTFTVRLPLRSRELATEEQLSRAVIRPGGPGADTTDPGETGNP